MAAAALLWAATPASAAEWTTLVADDFRVRLPGQSTPKESTTDTPFGQARTQEWSVEVDGVGFRLSVAYLPNQAAKPAKALEGLRDVAVSSVGGTLDRDFSIVVDEAEAKKKWPGREFAYHTEAGLQLNTRIYLVDSRLFTLTVVRPGDQVGEPTDFARFADSFKLKRKKERKDAGW